jgi:hypothetical protein
MQNATHFCNDCDSSDLVLFLRVDVDSVVSEMLQMRCPLNIFVNQNTEFTRVICAPAYFARTNFLRHDFGFIFAPCIYYVLIDYRLLNRQRYIQCNYCDYNKCNY